MNISVAFWRIFCFFAMGLSIGLFIGYLVLQMILGFLRSNKGVHISFLRQIMLFCLGASFTLILTFFVLQLVFRDVDIEMGRLSSLQDQIDLVSKWHYPLLRYMPHDEEDWSVNYVDILELNVLLFRDTEDTRQSAINWIQDKVGDLYWVHRINWLLHVNDDVSSFVHFIVEDDDVSSSLQGWTVETNGYARIDVNRENDLPTIHQVVVASPSPNRNELWVHVVTDPCYDVSVLVFAPQDQSENRILAHRRSNTGEISLAYSIEQVIEFPSGYRIDVSVIDRTHYIRRFVSVWFHPDESR